MFDPDRERERRDYCQYKRCKEVSDVIYLGNGYCDKHFAEIIGSQMSSGPHSCDCSDCMGGGCIRQEVVESEPTYASIEAWSEATGKRFRMTKAQKERGLTRQEAFSETHGNSQQPTTT